MRIKSKENLRNGKQNSYRDRSNEILFMDLHQNGIPHAI